MDDTQPHPGSHWVAEALARVLAFERHGQAISPLPEPNGDVTWDDVRYAAAQHRVVEVLFPHAKALGMDSDTVAIMYGMRHQLAAAGLKVQLDTNAVSGLLNAAGIDHLVVKGAALASLIGLEPSGRGAGDVDIWVRPRDVERAETVLHGEGWCPKNSSAPRPADGWRWRLLLAMSHELPQLGGGVSNVDLHYHLTAYAGERIPSFDTAYARSVPLPALNASVRTLCPADALRHMAQHARIDIWPNLRHVVDVVRVADRCDPAEVAEMARTEANVALAMAMAGHLVAVDLPGWECGRRIRRRADDSWRRCLSLHRSQAQRTPAVGRSAVASRIRYEWWLARSAPTWTTRASWAIKLAVPVRKLATPRGAPRS
jgi:hypothetical protein